MVAARGVMAIQLLPPRVVIDDKYGELVIKQLKDEHQKKKAKMLMELTAMPQGASVSVKVDVDSQTTQTELKK